MSISTTALMAASMAIKTTCDALVAQGVESAAAATAAAQAAVAKAEAAAQADIDSSTKALTAANNELTPLLATPAPADAVIPTPTPTPAPAAAPVDTAHAATVDANGNQVEGAATA